MQIILRTECVVCDAVLPPAQVIYKHTPIYMGVTDQLSSNDIFVNQQWSTCQKCGCVQLRELLDPATLYASSHTPGTVGNLWNKHHHDFAEFIAKKSPKNILEIGAGTTLLSSLIQEKVDIESYTIVDPNVVDNGDTNVRVIRELITPSFSLDEQFDTIIHSHTMEHFYQPVDELKSLVRLLADDGQMIVSVPLIINSIIDGFSNGLNFEHTYLTTVSNLYTIFARAGLHITAMCSFNQHNVFVTAIKDARSIQYPDDVHGNHKLWLLYRDRQFQDVVHINKIIKNVKSNVYLFGAHVFSQTLISNGISNVTGILDNDSNKHNKRLYGTPYIVSSPSTIIHDVEPYIIVRAGQYTSEITQQLRELNPAVNII